MYIEDIKRNIDQWHPLYKASVWEGAVSYVENEYVEKKIQEILSGS